MRIAKQALRVTGIFLVGSAFLVMPDGVDAQQGAAAPSEAPVREVKANSAEGAAKEFPGAGIRWQTFYRTGQIDLTTRKVSYSIGLAGMLMFPKDVEVLAIGNAVIREATDQDGNSVQPSRDDIVQAFGKDLMPEQNSFTQAPQRDEDGEFSGQMAVQLENITTKLTKLSALVGYIPVRVMSKSEAKVFEAKVGEPLPLTEGASLQIEQADIAEESATFTLNHRKALGKGQDAWSDQHVPPLICRMELLGEDGKVLGKAQNFYRNMTQADEGFTTSSVRCDFNGNLAGAKSIRVTFVTAAVEKQIPFALKELPLP